MKKQVRRKPFSTPEKKAALCMSFEIVSEWLSRQENGAALARKARDLCTAFRMAENPVRVLLQSESKRDDLTDVMLAVGVVKERAGGDPDRNFKPLRIADRRILQLCADVVSDGGSFNCARPKVTFACLPLPGCNRD